MSDDSPSEILIWNVSKTFQEIRLDAEMNQYQAAALLGKSQSRIHFIERGDLDMKLSTVADYADIYGYDVTVSFNKREGGT